ncbi:MAG: CapA family protein, partial [Ktedonobacteraceae bacterium]|nr:CapA family protein [Ktedonobacteraceae bacterium]
MGKQKTRSLNLLLVGDVMLGRHVNKVLTSEPAAYPWGDTLPLFQRADVRLCNLECVLSDRRTPGATTPKPFHFRSDAKNIAVLQAAQVDAVSLANNHTLDFGVDALDDMCHLLKQAGIRFAGAGPTFREASHPAIWEVHGKRLGLIACTDNEPGWAASGKHAGVWYVPAQIQDTRAHHLFEVVQRTKMKVTSLIVSLHWGPNWGDVPPANHHPFAHA